MDLSQDRNVSIFLFWMSQLTALDTYLIFPLSMFSLLMLWLLQLGVVSNHRKHNNNKSEIELWILTLFIQGWSPRPQGHGELFRSHISPLFRSPLIFKALATFLMLCVRSFWKRNPFQNFKKMQITVCVFCTFFQDFDAKKTKNEATISAFSSYPHAGQHKKPV